VIRSILQDKKGSALPLVIILIPILVILGVTLLNISLFEVKQAVYQEKKLQAHYLAWSGADATASWIVENNTTVGLLGKTSDWTSIPNVEKGKFQVNISGTVDNIKILSKGEIDGVTDEVTLLLTSIGGGPPTPVDDITHSDDLQGKWLNGGSNIIGGAIVSNDKPVQFYPNNGKDVIIANPNTVADFTAPAMYFDTGLRIRHNSAHVTLRAETILFRNNVTIDNGGRLTLFVPNLPGFPGGRDGSTIVGGIPGRKYGRVYFVNGVTFDNTMVIQPGAYYFPNGFTVPGDQSKTPANGGLITLNGYKKTWR